MKKIFLLLLLLVVNAAAQRSKEVWINGFLNRIAGENLDYHSCHPDANLALLIRCQNDKDFIEWETDFVPEDYNNPFVTFVWIAGYSTATSSAPHTFHLFVNDIPFFDFYTSPSDPEKNWSIDNKDGSSLKFIFTKLDQVDDFFGYMHLTIPVEKLSGLKNVRIKIKGDGSKSKDWYMTMQYPLVPKMRITPEKIVTKDGSGNPLQRVKISIDHFDSPQDVKIFSDGKEVVSSSLGLGMNDFYINYGAPGTKTAKSVIIEIAGKKTELHTTVSPARKITFYLIPHAHVDIGYTDLQTEIEKKHWNNFERAIEYSKRSSSNPAGSVFKWNPEVLWAVKSYLENFPEKREKFFNAVRNGWIGLDATYTNVMTGLCRPEELYELVDYSNRLEKEIGIKIESAMISDVPGYTWGTVQAFADNGIKYFSVGTNEFDRIGNTLKTWGDKPFYWKSPSGEKKILIWLAGKGYSWFHHWRLTRDDISPIAAYLDELDKNNYPYDIVHVRYNIGGDNGFPDSALADFVKTWNETHETPKFKIATNSEMFHDLETRYQKQIPTYSGDFTPYWEDGAGSTAKETTMNRKTSDLLTQLETLYTLTYRTYFPQKEFDEAWKYVLLFSEHTWGAWNSISDPDLQSVKDQWEIKKSYALKADSIAHKLYNDLAFKNRQKDEPVESLTVWNSSSWNRSGLVTISPDVKTAGEYIIDESGKQVPSQRLTTGQFAFVAKDVPALGSSIFNIVKDDPAQIPAYREEPDTGSWIKSVLENELSTYIDEGQYGFNDFIRTGRNASDIESGGLSKASPKEKGLVINSVQFSSSPPGCNSLVSEVRTFSNLNKIEIINTIDKKKTFVKENIRFSFPFNIINPTNRLDLAWSVIEPEKDQLPGANKNYFTLQRWADVSNNKRGITLATIDAPFIEIGGMTAEAWDKPTGQDWATKISPSSKIFSWVMNNSWHTNFYAAQEGIVSFRYALHTHGEFSYIDSYHFGIEESQPLIVTYTKNETVNPTSPFKLEGDGNIVATSVKPSRYEEAVIVRLYNPTDTLSKTQISLGGNSASKIYLSNVDGDETGEIKTPLTLKPFEVVTIKIKK